MKKLLTFLFMSMTTTFVLCENETLRPISFGRGVDYSKPCTDVDDDVACKSSNMVPNRNGAAFTRNGSRRLNLVAISSEPISSLFRTYITTSTITKEVLVAVSGRSIFYTTQTNITSLSTITWTTLYSSLNTRNQVFSFAVANNLIYMTGDALTDPVFTWDVLSSSFSVAFTSVSYNTAVFFAKYILYSENYMLYANIRDVSQGLANNTTYYTDRVYFSYALAPSSVTIDRYETIQGGNGEQITGMTRKYGAGDTATRIEFYKQSSISEMSYTLLDPVTGDQQITQMVKNYGHVSRYPPLDLGDIDIMVSKGSLVAWDGGRRQRLNLEEEKVVISKKIKSLIDKLVQAGTIKNTILHYYRKNEWMIMAYEDPDVFPRGVPNSSMIYDLLTGEWWPLKNWLICSMTDLNGFNDTGQMIYGDSKDGWVYITDEPAELDDPRREIVIDTMEKNDGWKSQSTVVGISNLIVAEGTASLRMTMTPSVTMSSMARIMVMPLGEWYDKSKTSLSDKISFKVFSSSVGVLKELRVDLEVKDVQNNFDTNYSSVSFSSAALTLGTSNWHTLEVALSSFPLLAEWTDFASETIPHARNQTRFGIRFVSTATSDMSLYIDDIRFVGATKTPLNPERWTKQYNFGTYAKKDIRQIILSREKPRNVSFKVDAFTGLGKLSNTKTIDAEVAKEIYVTGLESSGSITTLSTLDFSQVRSTSDSSNVVFDFHNGDADDDYTYTYDNYNSRLVKMDKSTTPAIVATANSVSYVQEISVDSEEQSLLWTVEHVSNTVVVRNTNDLSYVKSYGQLGRESTSFYNITGIHLDNKNMFIHDDTNQALKKFDRDFNFITKTELDINTVGNGSLRGDERYLYDLYNRGNDSAVFYIDIVIDKRNKSDMSLVNRVIVTPRNAVNLSTYSLTGSMAIASGFVYIPFTDNNGNYYIQKRLTSDFTLAEEYKTRKRIRGVMGDGYAKNSSLSVEKINLEIPEDEFVQLRFYSDELSSSFKLYQMAFVVEAKPYEE